MASSISWFDSEGFAVLANQKLSPGDRFGAWTPDRVPVGPSVVGLGTGRTHRFEFRRDDLVSFEIAAIPGTELQQMLRLKYHLMQGGEVLLTTDRPLASSFATCCIAPETVPSIEMSDRTNLEYTFSAVFKSLLDSSGEVDPSSPFYPAFVPGLKLWLHGDILTPTKSDADFVGGWYDASGLGNDAVQATESKQPRYYENILNGHPVVTFDGIDDWLFTPDIIVPTVSPGSTLFWVARRTGAFAAHQAFFSFASAAADNFCDESSVMEKTSGNVEWYSGVPYGTADMIGSGAAATFNAFALVFASTSVVTPYLNAVAGTPFDVYGQIESLSRNNMRLGAADGSGVLYGAACDIGEMLWYEGVLSADRRNGIFTYLNTKYDLY